MTEVERIIKEGILPLSFFEEETVCGFLVTKERKKIWAINVDLLCRFDSICRRHNLHYSMAFGSLLGIIRHDGFIPWDDDIDVVMPREDYEKLKAYKSEFDYPYFLQFPGEDKGYCFSFAKLRNSNTTGVSVPFRYEDFNQGIFIDIFPMDNYCADGIESKISYIKRLISECSAMMRRSNPVPDAVDLQKMSGFQDVREKTMMVKELDDILRQNNDSPSNEYIVWCCPIYDYKKMLFHKAYFDNLIEILFYGHPVFIPKSYDKVLSITYGNYMELPPLDKRGTWHSQNVFNPDIPYTTILQYLRDEDKIEIL